jgi:hypothetical protein
MPELLLSSVVGDECPECHCAHDSGFTLSPGLSPAEEAKARERISQEGQKLHLQCIAEEKAREARDKITRTCQLLLVDPCRKEAFMRCTGRNGSVESGDPPTGRTLVFSWGTAPDGGSGLGLEGQP